MVKLTLVIPVPIYPVVFRAPYMEAAASCGVLAAVCAAARALILSDTASEAAAILACCSVAILD